MPVDDNGVGYSGHTADKQEKFRRLIRLQLRMAYPVMQQAWASNMYWYFDLHAGPGMHDEYGAGSPLIFCEEAERFASEQPGFQYRALMVDAVEANRGRLQGELDARGYWNAAATHEDNRVILSEYAVPKNGNKLGLFYLDPTRPDDMPWEELAICSHYWKRADILLRLPATAFKRVQHINGHKRLRDYLDAIDKQHIGVMEPSGRHQWTFVYLTNGRVPDWKKIGFYPVDSKDGQRVWETLTKTNEERAENEYQPTLFNLRTISEPSPLSQYSAGGD